MNKPVCLHRRAAVAAVLASVVLLGGCAEVMVIGTAANMVAALPSNEPHWVETNRLTVGYTATDVYTAAEREVEKNDRQIVERDAASHVLRVSYPFSLLKNNWGGTIKLICLADIYGTTVVLFGDGRDALPRVRAIGQEMLGDLVAALRRLPRTL